MPVIASTTSSPTPFATVTLANLSRAKHPQQDCVLGVLTAWMDLVLLA